MIAPWSVTMDTYREDLPKPTKVQKVALYLLTAIISGIGIYIILNAVFQIWK